MALETKGFKALIQVAKKEKLDNQVKVNLTDEQRLHLEAICSEQDRTLANVARVFIEIGMKLYERTRSIERLREEAGLARTQRQLPEHSDAAEQTREVEQKVAEKLEKGKKPQSSDTGLESTRLG